jgi:CRP-like cAMP-binding protein
MDVVQQFNEGETLIEEGARDKTFYILARGRLGVFKGDRMVAEITGKGAVVGELGVILNQPRSASIRTLEKTYAVPVSGDLDSIVKSHPDIVKAVLISLAEKVARTTDDLYELAENAPIEES